MHLKIVDSILIVQAPPIPEGTLLLQIVVKLYSKQKRYHLKWGYQIKHQQPGCLATIHTHQISSNAERGNACR